MSAIPVFGFYYNAVFSNTLEKNADRFLSTSIDIIRKDIDRNFEFTNDTSMNFLADKLLREKLNDYIAASDIQRRNQLKYEIERQMQFALNFNSLWREKLIDTVFIFVDDEHFFNVTRSIPDSTTNTLHQQIYQASLQMEDQSKIFPSPAPADNIYFVRTINDLEQFKPIGKMIMSLNTQNFNKVDASLIHYEGIITFTFNETGTVFFHSDQALTGTVIDQDLYARRASDDIFEYAIKDSTYYMKIIPIKNHNLFSAIGIPKEQVLSESLAVRRNYLLTLSLVMVSSISIALLIFRRITQPLVLITDATQKIINGDYKSELPGFRYRELNHVSLAFNQMLQRLDHLINQVLKKQLLIQETELKMLQAQVNPHFLFNVLDTISWEATMSGQVHIQELLSSLAELIRHNILFSKKEVITVQDELDYIDYYLQLQKARFEDKISFDLTLENESLKQCYIPKLSLQPFIDNAIVHGIEPGNKNGHIHLSIREEEGSLLCQVSDDGIGFDYEASRLKLQNDDSDQDSKHTHIGIINIVKRIHILYGDQYGITIDSSPGKGTRVLMTLPIKTEGDV